LIDLAARLRKYVGAFSRVSRIMIIIYLEGNA
jgi:hypothetical protein